MLALFASGEASAQTACLSAAEHATWRTRVLQQQIMIATLQCQGNAAARIVPPDYMTMLEKFKAEFAANGSDFKALAERRGRGTDALMTDLAGRIAQRAVADREFCAASKKSLEHLLAPSTTSLAGVEPAHDFSAEMNLQPCSPRSP